MSGGSYNYLCNRDADELLSGNGLSDLESMTERLLLVCPEAAMATEQISALVRMAQLRMQTRIDLLKDLWRAVEWVDSNDWHEDQLTEAIELWRKANIGG